MSKSLKCFFDFQDISSFIEVYIKMKLYQLNHYFVERRNVKTNNYNYCFIINADFALKFNLKNIRFKFKLMLFKTFNTSTLASASPTMDNVCSSDVH